MDWLATLSQSFLTKKKKKKKNAGEWKYVERKKNLINPFIIFSNAKEVIIFSNAKEVNKSFVYCHK